MSCGLHGPDSSIVTCWSIGEFLAYTSHGTHMSGSGIVRSERPNWNGHLWKPGWALQTQLIHISSSTHLNAISAHIEGTPGRHGGCWKQLGDSCVYLHAEDQENSLAERSNSSASTLVFNRPRFRGTGWKLRRPIDPEFWMFLVTFLFWNRCARSNPASAACTPIRRERSRER